MNRNAAGIRATVLLVALAALSVWLLPLTGRTVEAHGGSAPATPSGLTAVGFHGGIWLSHHIVSPHVILSWDDPGDAGVTHYLVFRRDADAYDEGGFTLVGCATGSAPTRYVDRSVENNSRYVYRIVAANEHGQSGPSHPAEADTYLAAFVPFPGMGDAPQDD